MKLQAVELNLQNQVAIVKKEEPTFKFDECGNYLMDKIKSLTTNLLITRSSFPDDRQIDP